MPENKVVDVYLWGGEPNWGVVGRYIGRVCYVKGQEPYRGVEEFFQFRDEWGDGGPLEDHVYRSRNVA